MRALEARVSLACWLIATPAVAQIDGHVSVLFDALPAAGDPVVAEMRTRVFAEHRREVGDRLRLNLSAYVDGLLADRTASGGSRTSADAVIRPGDIYAELQTTRFDLRVGASRLVWGRLDEFQPTDVVNPIDLTRFLLEGRGEARLPVGLVRARAFLPASSTLEAVLVPAFRPSRFDQLEEATSPFNLARNANVICPPAGLGPCRLLAIERREPQLTWSNVQGGVRFTSTLARVDWGLSAYRGFRTFPTFQVTGTRLVESFPRFTMIGGDFETVRGQWGIRGELATFAEPDRTFEGGAGADRRAGDYRVAGNVVVSHARGDTNVTLVAVGDRRFARETRTVRVLVAYDPDDSTAFVRGIAAASLRDDVWIEGSAGVFAGSSLDVLGRLTDRDFLYARLKVFF
jgi:hypothetical protein